MTFLEVASMVVTLWIVAFLRSDAQYCNDFNSVLKAYLAVCSTFNTAIPMRTSCIMRDVITMSLCLQFCVICFSLATGVFECKKRKHTIKCEEG